MGGEGVGGFFCLLTVSEEIESDEPDLFFLFLPQRPCGEQDWEEEEEEEACDSRSMTHQVDS